MTQPIEPLIWDPSTERLGQLCWRSINRDPALWVASEPSVTQGQAWFSDRDEVAFLLWIDGQGLAQTYRFGGPDQTRVERVEDGRRLWSSVRRILENADQRS